MVAGVSILHGEIKKGSTFEAMKETFVSLCTAYKIETEPVCKGFFDVFGPELLPAYASSKLGNTLSLDFKIDIYFKGLFNFRW